MASQAAINHTAPANWHQQDDNTQYHYIPPAEGGAKTSGGRQSTHTLQRSRLSNQALDTKTKYFGASQCKILEHFRLVGQALKSPSPDIFGRGGGEEHYQQFYDSDFSRNKVPQKKMWRLFTAASVPKHEATRAAEVGAGEGCSPATLHMQGDL